MYLSKTEETILAGMKKKNSRHISSYEENNGSRDDEKLKVYFQL